MLCCEADADNSDPGDDADDLVTSLSSILLLLFTLKLLGGGSTVL